MLDVTNVTDHGKNVMFYLIAPYSVDIGLHQYNFIANLASDIVLRVDIEYFDIMI